MRVLQHKSETVPWGRNRGPQVASELMWIVDNGLCSCLLFVFSPLDPLRCEGDSFALDFTSLSLVSNSLSFLRVMTTFFWAWESLIWCIPWGWPLADLVTYLPLSIVKSVNYLAHLSLYWQWIESEGSTCESALSSAMAFNSVPWKMVSFGRTEEDVDMSVVEGLDNRPENWK